MDQMTSIAGSNNNFLDKNNKKHESLILLLKIFCHSEFQIIKLIGQVLLQVGVDLDLKVSQNGTNNNHQSCLFKNNS